MNAPTCEVKTGKARITYTYTYIPTLEECERECDDNCIAWKFYLLYNKPSCSKWLFEGKFLKTFILNHDIK